MYISFFLSCFLGPLWSMPRHCLCSGVLSVFASLHLSFFLSVSVCLSLLVSVMYSGAPFCLSLSIFSVLLSCSLSLSFYIDPNVPPPAPHCMLSGRKWAGKTIPDSVGCPASDLHCIPARGVWGLCPKAGWQCPLVPDQHQLPLTPCACCRSDSSTVRDWGPRLTSS